MDISTRKPSSRQATAQKRAAEQAKEVAKTLQSFAASLISLDALTKHSSHTPEPTSRNWWRVQAGRFKDDPTFSDFVAQVQAARRQEG